MAVTVREAIRELAASMQQTLEALLELPDEELLEASSHVCAHGKDVWTLITNDKETIPKRIAREAGL